MLPYALPQLPAVFCHPPTEDNCHLLFHSYQLLSALPQLLDSMYTTCPPSHNATSCHLPSHSFQFSSYLPSHSCQLFPAIPQLPAVTCPSLDVLWEWRLSFTFDLIHISSVFQFLLASMKSSDPIWSMTKFATGIEFYTKNYSPLQKSFIYYTNNHCLFRFICFKAKLISHGTFRNLHIS